MNHIEIIQSVWFNLVGFVQVYDTITEEYKYYIGTGNGFSRSADEEHVAAYGAKFDRRAALVYLNEPERKEDV